VPVIPVGGQKRATPEDDEEDLQIGIVKVITSFVSHTSERNLKSILILLQERYAHEISLNHIESCSQDSNIEYY